MSDKAYSIWLAGFLLSLSWYVSNLGLMEFLRFEPRPLVGIFFILSGVFAWFFGWRSNTRRTILSHIKSNKQAASFVFQTMAVLFLAALYEMHFMFRESSLALVQDDFLVWRAWMSYIGLIIALSASIINFWAINWQR